MILERDIQLGQLRQLLEDLDSSGGRVVLVRGEAGIGKSALIAQFTAEIEDRAHVLVGACDDLLTPQPLGPVWDVARADSSIAAPLAAGDRRTVMDLLLDLLSRALRPTVLVLEDMHWADEATLDAVTYLGRRIARTNGLLVLIYRDGEVDYDHPLRGVIGGLPPQSLVRMPLDRLSPEAVEAMVGDTGLDPDAVVALTGGNPLFVTEVLASGIEKVPSSVQDSVLARAAKLSSDARRILDLISVIPGTPERRFVDGILEPTQVQLTECVRPGLLRVEDDTISFHHELARRAIESALSASDRRRLNRQVLSALVGRADPARLVHHGREADDADAIIEFAPQAARAAMAIGSYREAAAHFRLLQPHLDLLSEDERAAIVDAWARAEYYLTSSESADILARALALHRSTGNDLALARALTFAVRVNEITGRPESAEEASREAITILESHPPSADLAAAVSQRAWLMKMRGDRPRAVETAERAIRLAEETGDELSSINALITKGHMTLLWGDPNGFHMLEEARSRAEHAGYPFEESLALMDMAGIATEHRDLERAGDLSQRARHTAARYEIEINENAANAHYARVLDWRGEWAKAEDTATDAAGAHLAKVMDRKGEGAKAGDTATGALGHALFYSQLVAGQVLGSLLARQGRPGARTILSSIWQRADAGDEMLNLLPSAAGLAEYMWLTGERDAVLTARFLDMLEDTRRLAFPWSAGWLAFWLWALGELSEAPDGIAEPYRLVMEGRPTEAAAIWDAKGIPYERGLALMHGDEKARLEALEVFETLGAIAVAAKLRKALRDGGVAAPRGKGRQTRRHAAGLTARQAEVLQLLDEGLSNTEIADRLFVSRRTVEHHVEAILMKLEVSTREAAVGEARDRGILTTS